MTKPYRDRPPGDLQRTGAMTMMLFICTGIGLIWGFLLGGLFMAIVVALALDLVMLLVFRFMVTGGANTFAGFLLPNAPVEQTTSYSHIDALEMRGDLAGAMRAWEDAIAASADAIAARMRAAELYAGKANNPARAATLFRDVQLHSRSNDDTRRFATQRLVDLYLGPLNDEARAVIELRRIAERWPNSREAEGARAAVKNIEGR